MGDSSSPPSPGGTESISGTVAEAPGQLAQDTPPPKAEAAEAKPGRREKKRECILKAATRLFARNEFHGVLMEDISAEAGVGKGTLYRYFKTKDDLFVESVFWAAGNTIDHLRAHLAPTVGTERALREVVWHTLHFFKSNDSFFHMLHHHKVDHSCKAREAIHEKRGQLWHLMEEMIAAGVEAGLYREIDVHVSATMLWGMIRSSIRRLDDYDPKVLVDHISELFTKGVQA